MNRIRFSQIDAASRNQLFQQFFSISTDPTMSPYFDQWAFHYYNEFGRALDCSLSIETQNNAIGFWPLAIVEGNGTSWLGYYAKQILEPLVMENMADAFDQHAPEALNSVLEIARANQVQELLYRSTGQFPAFESYLLENYNFEEAYVTYCDLSEDLGQLWTKLRKSYKSLINRETTKYSVEIINQLNYRGLSEFAALHEEASGRRVRSLGNWEVQGSAIKHGAGIACYIRDDKAQLVGASFCHFLGGAALYSSGAYNRQLEQDGVAISHLSQWETIKYLKSSTQVKKYILDFGASVAELSEKERNILHFKKGFGRSSLVHRIFKIPTSN
jgi:FemAB family protein